MNWLQAMNQTSTAGSADTTMMLSIGGTNARAGCMHSIERVGARGSNGHVRKEQGRCVWCDMPFERVIRWDTKDARSWWDCLMDRETKIADGSTAFTVGPTRLVCADCGADGRDCQRCAGTGVDPERPDPEAHADKISVIAEREHYRAEAARYRKALEEARTLLAQAEQEVSHGVTANAALIDLKTATALDVIRAALERSE